MAEVLSFPGCEGCITVRSCTFQNFRDNDHLFVWTKETAHPKRGYHWQILKVKLCFSIETDHLIILNVNTHFKKTFQHFLRKTHGGEKMPHCISLYKS